MPPMGDAGQEAGIKVGVISDTHGLLRSEALDRLQGVDHILHAGDIGAPEIMEALNRIAPTTAIRGNVDRGAWATAFPETCTVKLGGLTIHLVHDLKALAIDASAVRPDIVISGHSHRPLIAVREGTLFLNPGSAGPRRFRLPVTLASLLISDGKAEPALHQLLP